MTLAIVLVIAAVLALVFILRCRRFASLQVSADASLAAKIQPIDVEAFRNLVDPAEDDYLRRRLSAFGVSPRAAGAPARHGRLRTDCRTKCRSPDHAWVKLLLAASDSDTAEAARQLVDNALLLRRNAVFALFRIYVALAWPNSGWRPLPFCDGYQQLNGSAMLLGRLQNPAVPVRISATW